MIDKMKNYELKISQLIDNELSTEEGKELFFSLSENEEGRRIFADFIDMKKEAKSYYTGMITELNEPKIVITNVSPKDKKEKKYKMGFYFSAAASILFAFFLLSNLLKENAFATKYENLQAEFVTLEEEYSNLLSEQIKLVQLNNKLFAEKGKPKAGKVKINEPVKKAPNMQKTKMNKQQKRPNYQNRNDYLASIPNYAITKDDFLGQQVIGN
jgi:hypothetical protein